MNSIIERIKKLRALSTSSNVHEAAAAAAAAERLIQQHAIDESQLQDKEEGVVEAPDALYSWSCTKPPVWQQSLINELTDLYRCSGWLSHNFRGHTIFRVTGRPSDVEILKYQAAYFVAEIIRLTSLNCKGQGRRIHNSFAWGATTAVIEALKATNREVRASSTSTALARVDAVAEAAVELRDKILGKNMTMKKASFSVNQGAYEAGQRAGAGINQRSQIGAGGMRLLGGGQ